MAFVSRYVLKLISDFSWWNMNTTIDSKIPSISLTILTG